MKKKIELDTGAFWHLTEERKDVSGALQAVREKIYGILTGAPAAVPAVREAPAPKTEEKPEKAAPAAENRPEKAVPAPAAKASAAVKAAPAEYRPGAAGTGMPFSAQQTVSSIPALARGAVLPANRPFLTVVGDRKPEADAQAPLTAIREAVALVMADQTEAVTAGMEANLSLQRKILDAVRSIRIGDEMIAAAGERYYRWKTVAEGGVL